MCNRISTLLMAAVALLALAAPLAAQQEKPRVDISAGYAFMRDQTMKDLGFDKFDFPTGWVASVAGRMGWLSLVGEVGGHYMTDSEINIKFIKYTFLGGARFSSGRRTTPFVQVLAGATRLTTILDAGQPNEETVPESNYLTIQPGGGVDVGIGSAVGIRLQGDYRLYKVSTAPVQWNKQIRATASLVFFLGGH